MGQTGKAPSNPTTSAHTEYERDQGRSRRPGRRAFVRAHIPPFARCWGINEGTKTRRPGARVWHSKVADEAIDAMRNASSSKRRKSAALGSGLSRARCRRRG
eukprot:scaffold6271_cov68-Phaeocystis_antarctica.AAC.4